MDSRRTAAAFAAAATFRRSFFFLSPLFVAIKQPLPLSSCSRQLA